MGKRFLCVGALLFLVSSRTPSQTTPQTAVRTPQVAALDQHRALLSTYCSTCHSERVKSGASPRHVPARIVQVPDIPRTRSGKIVELAVRDIVHGRPIGNREALANPEALAHFAGREELES